MLLAHFLAIKILNYVAILRSVLESIRCYYVFIELPQRTKNDIIVPVGTATVITREW